MNRGRATIWPLALVAAATPLHASAAEAQKGFQSCLLAKLSPPPAAKPNTLNL
jgi:hypothetical protein